MPQKYQSINKSKCVLLVSLPFSLSSVIMTSASRATLIRSSTKLLKVSFIVLVLRKREANGTGGVNSEIREDTDGRLNTEKGHYKTRQDKTRFRTRLQLANGSVNFFKILQELHLWCAKQIRYYFHTKYFQILSNFPKDWKKKI